MITSQRTPKAKLVNAIPEIAILIAGADGTIDEDEMAWSKKVPKIRTFAGPKSLRAFYEMASDGYDERFSSMLGSLPAEVDSRTAQLVDRLTDLNEILASLDNELAYDLYKSLLSYAKHVAKASGGFFRMWSISKVESRLVDLPMLKEIELLEAREEDLWEEKDEN